MLAMKETRLDLNCYTAIKWRAWGGIGGTSKPME